MDDPRTDRGEPYTPTAPEAGSDRIVATPTQVLRDDVLDALVAAVAIFAVFYLGSLAQRMGAR